LAAPADVNAWEGPAARAQTYRGGADPAAVRGGFRMVYQLEGCPARMPALCAAVGATPDVHAWSLCCDWPGDEEAPASVNTLQP